MSTLDAISALIAARQAADPDAIARALIALERRMAPDAIADLITALDAAPAPAAPATRQLVARAA
jgi:hypothetical protein